MLWQNGYKARFTIIDDFTANKPGKNQIGYTSYIQNELDPNWAGERLQLDLTPGGDRPIRLRVEVWDKDVKTADDLIVRWVGTVASCADACVAQVPHRS